MRTRPRAIVALPVAAALLALPLLGCAGCSGPDPAEQGPPPAAGGAPFSGPELPDLTRDRARATRPAPNLTVVRQQLRAALKAGAPGAFVAVSDVDAGPYPIQTVGMADLAARRPMDPRLRFRVASVTKTFTAALVMQLVGEGKIGLDQPIQRYLPKGTLPPNWKASVRQVLQHRAGFYDYGVHLLNQKANGTVDNFETYLRNVVYQPQQMVDMAVRRGPQSRSGTSYLYTNTDYLLLGMAIEKATGQTYGQALTSRIFGPLRMTQSYYPVPEKKIAGPHITGYLSEDDRSKPPVNATEQNMTWMNSAGGIISNAADLQRFHRALLGGRLVRPALLRQMLIALPYSKGPHKGAYGLGLKDYTLPCGQHVVGHDGVVQGYQTQLFSTVDGRRQVVIFANASNNTGVYNAEVRALDAAFCG